MRWVVLPAMVLATTAARAQPVDAPPAPAPDAAPATEPEPEPEPDAVKPPEPDAEPEPDEKDKGKDKGKGKGKDKDKDLKPDKKAKKASPYEPKINGYIQVLWQRPFDTNDDGNMNPSTFRIERARFELDGKIMKKLGYALGVDPKADDITGVLRDAFIWSHHIPFHELRVGQQKTQFGYENVESSTKLYYVNRSRVSGELSRGPTTRDIGLGIVGEIPLGGGFSVEDGLTVVNGAGQNVQTDTTRRKSWWGRLGGRYQSQPLDLDVRLGVSGAIGDGFDPGLDLNSPLDDFHFDFKRIGVDVQADYTWAFVSAEYVFGRDTDQQTDVDYDGKGYYVMVAGKTPWKAGPVVRYDSFDDDFTDYQRWTFGAYYGTRAAVLRAMVNFEHRPDRDDRLILWSQAKF